MQPPRALARPIARERAGCVMLGPTTAPPPGQRIHGELGGRARRAFGPSLVHVSWYVEGCPGTRRVWSAGMPRCAGTKLNSRGSGETRQDRASATGSVEVGGSSPPRLRSGGFELLRAEADQPQVATLDSRDVHPSESQHHIEPGAALFARARRHAHVRAALTPPARRACPSGQMSSGRGRMPVRVCDY